jgi:hypothetical protein
MITYRLGVDDLAATRFAISPLQETVCSLWAVAEPGRAAIHLPWLRAIRPALEAPAGLRSRHLVTALRAG